MSARRRRALALLALALACGGLAASQVRGRIAAVERRTGPLAPALVTTREVPAGRRLSRADLALRRVPDRYLPPDALGVPGAALGARTSLQLPAGAYLTGSTLGGQRARRRAGALRPGERAVDVAVAGGDALAQLAIPGARVDVLVSTQQGAAGGRTQLALRDVELLALRPGGGASGAEGAESRATATATLRVTLGEAVFLTQAENFAREVRLLVRP